MTDKERPGILEGQSEKSGGFRGQGQWSRAHNFQLEWMSGR